MAFTLPSLTYKYDSLEPYIDARTMEIHHTKHHQAYIDKVNAAIDGTRFAEMSVEQLISDLAAVPENIRTVVRNHGGGHANHTMFWSIMGSASAGLGTNFSNQPSKTLLEVISRDLGGMENFKQSFVAASLNRFGSGWAWLSVDKGKLIVESTANQDSPLMEGRKPILGLDVWEHAYYLKYQNRRPEYVEAFFNVINWQEVEKLYKKA